MAARKFTKEEIDRLIERAENLEMEDLEEMRRECKFRVRVQEIVSASQMSRMSEYQLKRMENIKSSVCIRSAESGHSVDQF